MQIHMLKAKIHRATVTGADLNYEGSISIDPKLYRAAAILPFEKVDIYNINNGMRFSTYVIEGRDGEITLNGAAARCAQCGDLLIIAAYCTLDADEAAEHRPKVISVDAHNRIR